MQAHQADLCVSTEDHVEWHGIADGDCPGQRLTSECWHRQWLACVHDIMCSRELHGCRWNAR
jgi:hypothetical protein